MRTNTLTHSHRLAQLPLPELALLLTAFFWGTSYGVAKDALLYTGVLAFMVIRFGLTSIILLPFYWRQAAQGHTKHWLSALPTGGILLCIFLAEIYGIFHTTASNAAFLISLCVLMTPFVETVVTRKWPDKNTLAFALLSVFGVVLLTQDVSFFTAEEQGGIQLNRGDYFILLAAFLRACMVVATNTLLKGKQLSALSITSIQSNVVALGGLIILLSSNIQLSTIIPTDWNFWWLMLYLVLCCTIFAFFAQNYGLKHTSPSRVALLMGSEPTFGALFAFVWLGESLSVIQMIGGGCILLATLMASLMKTTP